MGQKTGKGKRQTDTGETAPDDLDERFREAIQRGDTSGDVVIPDEQGIEIKNAPACKTIFDF